MANNQEDWLQNAAAWLVPSGDEKRLNEAIAKTSKIVEMYRLERGAKIARPAEDRRSVTKPVCDLAKAKNAAKGITPGTFIDLFGNDDEPLTERYYDKLIGQLSCWIEQINSAASRIESASSSAEKGDRDAGGGPRDLAKWELVERCYDVTWAERL